MIMTNPTTATPAGAARFEGSGEVPRETDAAAWRAPVCASRPRHPYVSSLDGLLGGDHPRLEVRAGTDDAHLVLAAEPR